jgi:chemotaxis protein methyltransferase CheR
MSTEAGPSTGDAECVAFLKWALPHMRLRWEGFRKVRRQVCRRLWRRLGELGVADLPSYRRLLEAHPGEWRALAALCRVTISRFHRDLEVFALLGHEILPELAWRARAEGRARLRAWSCGCASGEEAWSLRLSWERLVAPRSLGQALFVIGTDIDLTLLARARRAVYPESSLRELPDGYRQEAFEPHGADLRLRDRFRHGVAFLAQELREARPGGGFDLVLCRNLAFTYFDAPAQLQAARRLGGALRPGGVLMLGARESLPDGVGELASLPDAPGLYRRRWVA